MRGADALPGSKATSRAQGSYRTWDISYLVFGRQALRERDGPRDVGYVVMRQRILDYNEDDCRATRVLLDGIRALAIRI